MADFDEKLNQILSNPDAMAQIARLAQSLDAPAPATDSADASSATKSAAAPSATKSGAAPPVTDSGAADASPPDVSNTANASGGSTPFPALPNDENSIARFLPLLQELSGDSNARRLLYALRPYLRPQKQEKVERALRLARLFRVGKKFLSQWEG